MIFAPVMVKAVKLNQAGLIKTQITTTFKVTK